MLRRKNDITTLRSTAVIQARSIPWPVRRASPSTLHFPLDALVVVVHQLRSGLEVLCQKPVVAVLESFPLDQIELAPLFVVGVLDDGLDNILFSIAILTLVTSFVEPSG